MNTPNHPPRVWIYRVLVENKCHFDIGGTWLPKNVGNAPDNSYLQYLAKSEHEALLSQAQSRIRELEEVLEGITKLSSDDLYKRETIFKVVDACEKALAAKGTK